jgi:glutamate racemase
LSYDEHPFFSSFGFRKCIMNHTAPIGIFDSGYGGLTILADIKKKLPEYDFLYLGDNARAPYGTRSFEVVYKFTLEAVLELFARGCELVIIACNTASAKALRNIQQKDLPLLGENKRVLGVIRPSTEMIGTLTHTNHVGILATEGTIKSNSYQLEIAKFYPDIRVVQQACPMWVPLIENNYHETVAGKIIIQEDVEKLLKKDKAIDTIILGCTHYPIIKTFIESIVPKGVKIIAQGSLVADKLAKYLIRHPDLEERCSKHSSMHFLTSENASDFDKNASHFIGFDVKSERISL